LNRLLKNTLTSSADTIILIVLSLIATPILIKYFGVEAYGVFLFLSIFTITGALSFFDFGMEGALMMHIARYEAEGLYDKINNAFLNSIIYYSVIGGTLSLAINLSSDFIIRNMDLVRIDLEQLVFAIQIISINALVQFLISPFAAVLQGMHRFTITNGISSLYNIVQYVTIIIIASWTQRFDLALFGVACVSLFRLGTYIYIYFRMPNIKFRFHFDLILFKELWLTSNTLFLNRIIGLIYNQTGKILIWLKLPIQNMVVYEVSNRPASLVRVLGSMCYSAIIPEVSKLAHGNLFSEIRILYIRLLRYMYLLIIPTIVVFSVHASRILDIWLGAEFIQYASLVQLFMLSSLLLPLSSLASTLYVGLDKIKETVWISAVGTIIFVIAGFVLISANGVMGLVAGLLISELIMFVLYFKSIKKIINVTGKDLATHISPIFSLAIVMLALQQVPYFFKESTLAWLILVIVLTLIHYVLQLIYFLDQHEKTYLKNRISKITGYRLIS